MADQITLEEIPKLKVSELKKLLKERGLPITGAKSELVERLTSAMSSQDTEESDTFNEDSVLTEEIELTEVSEVTTTKKAAENPTPVPAETTKVTEPVEEAKEKSVPVAKISSGLTEAERLKKRAERFGVTSADAKKQARAERFGLSSGGSSGTTGAVTSGASVDVLKKRAERFGQVTSTSLSKVAEEERIRKRKERFGAVTAGSGEIKKIKLNELDEKKRKRAERFGLT